MDIPYTRTPELISHLKGMHHKRPKEIGPIVACYMSDGGEVNVAFRIATKPKAVATFQIDPVVFQKLTTTHGTVSIGNI